MTESDQIPKYYHKSPFIFYGYVEWTQNIGIFMGFKRFKNI